MVGDDEDDEVEQSVVVKEKGSKRGPSHYVCTSLVHVSNNELHQEKPPFVIITKYSKKCVKHDKPSDYF